MHKGHGTDGWGKKKASSANKSATTAGSKRSAGSGAEFKSSRAGGDVRRKGQKLEPYAYIPLDAKVSRHQIEL